MSVTKLNILKRPRFATFVAGAVAGAMLLGLAGGGSSAMAQNADQRDIYIVRGVEVDVTADNVIQAREQGMVEGRIAAFRKLVERLVAPEDVERVPQPSASEIITMVRDFSVSGERSSAVRYLAELTVRFHPGPVRAVLRSAGVPFTETVSKPLVVIPLYREQAGMGLQLWDDPNPWRAAWNDPVQSNGLIPYVLPLGDIEDLTSLSTEQAITGDPQALGALANRYQTAGSLVAVAEVSKELAVSAEGAVPEANTVPENPEPQEVINVLMTLTTRHQDLPPDQIVVTYAGEPGAELEDVLTEAANAAAASVENTWKAVNRVSFDTLTQITALIPVSGMDDWIGVKNQLDAVPLIERMDLQAMTRDRVQVLLSYAGDTNQFNLALSQSDLMMTNQAGVWVIEREVRKDSAVTSMSVPQNVPPPSSPPSVTEQ